MARAEIDSLRPGRLGKSPLVVALLISLLLHLGGGTVYELGKKYGWWKKLAEISLIKKTLKNHPAQLVKKDDEPPIIFVDVSHPDTEAPKQAKYYSNKSSQAANPDADQNADVPRINGSQTVMPKTEDVPKQQKLQPDAPPPQPRTAETKPHEPQEKIDPMSLGDRELKKTEEPAPPPQPEQKPRPRTLAEARAQQQLPGQKLQQNGGVHRQLQWSSLDVKSTAFGDYDRAIIDAVTSHWYSLLDSHRFAEDRTGKVTVHFKLQPDGTIVEVEMTENTVGQLLGYVCEEAISESAPFGKWPSDMRREIGANYRDISFTFYYY